MISHNTAPRLSGAPEIGRRLDRLPITVLHAAIIAACAIGFGFDLLEVALGNALSAVFSAPPHKVPTGQLSLLLSAVYIGAIPGAPAMGWLADRFGRRAVLTGGLLWLAVVSLAMLSTDRIGWLTVFRALAGVSLGAYPPLMLAYLTDVLPPARRGMLIMVAIAIGSLGQPVGILLIRWLTPIQPLGIEAWKWAFLVGSAGAVVAAIIFRLVPESPRWLAATGRGERAEAGCRAFESSKILWRLRKTAPRRARAAQADVPTAALADRSRPSLWQHRRALALMGGLYFLCPWATVGFPLTSGAVLIAKGFKLSDTLLYIGISTFGAFLGTSTSAFVADRIERRTALALCAGIMALAVMIFAVSTAPGWLIASNLAFFFLSNIYLAALGVYAAELFPTQLRSSAAASAWAVNRVSSASAPPLLLYLMHTQGIVPMYVVVAATLAVSVIFVLTFAPRGRAGLPVT